MKDIKTNSKENSDKQLFCFCKIKIDTTSVDNGQLTTFFQTLDSLMENEINFNLKRDNNYITFSFVERVNEQTCKIFDNIVNIFANACISANIQFETINEFKKRILESLGKNGLGSLIELFELLCSNVYPEQTREELLACYNILNPILNSSKTDENVQYTKKLEACKKIVN